MSVFDHWAQRSQRTAFVIPITPFTSLSCAQDPGGENPYTDTKDGLKLLIVGDSAVRLLVTLGARPAWRKAAERLPNGQGAARSQSSSSAYVDQGGQLVRCHSGPPYALIAECARDCSDLRATAPTGHRTLPPFRAISHIIHSPPRRILPTLFCSP
jgi:hypothetical protein